MSSKFSILPVIVDQYATLRDSSTGKVRFEDYGVLLGLPAAVCLWSGLAGWRVSIVAELISAIAIITALLFGLVIFLFQLRLQMGTPEVNERIPSTSVQLVDEMFKNVAYSIIVGFAATVVTLAGAALRQGDEQRVGVKMTAFIVFTVAHFIFTLAMCLKRLTRAYDKVATL